MTDKYLEEVFEHEHFDSIAYIVGRLDKTLYIPDNLYAVINHQDIAKLSSEVSLELKILDQASFEDCLARAGSVADN